MFDSELLYELEELLKWVVRNTSPCSPMSYKWIPAVSASGSHVQGQWLCVHPKTWLIAAYTGTAVVPWGSWGSGRLTPRNRVCANGNELFLVFFFHGEVCPKFKIGPSLSDFGILGS